MKTQVSATVHTNRCYILIGLPSSGKSCWADRILSNWKNSAAPAIICAEDVIRQMCEEHGREFNELCEAIAASGEEQLQPELDKKFNAALGVNRDIIVDAYNLSEKDRAVYLDRLPNHYQKIGIVFSIPDRMLLDRLSRREAHTHRLINNATLGHMRKRYDAPGMYEFDRKTTIDQTCVYC